MRQKTYILIAITVVFTIVMRFNFGHIRFPLIYAQEEDNKDLEEEIVKTQEEKIKDLKNRLATKVAEIRESQKGALSGIIKEKKTESFILVTKKDEFKAFYNEDDTEIEEFTAGQTQETKITSLKNGIFVTVFGLIDEQGQEIDAKRILIKPQIISLTGTIAEVDSENFTIDIQTINNELFKVDFEKTTKAFVVNEDNKIEKSGFSKFGVNDRIHVRAINIDNEDKTAAAVRILHIPLDIFEEAKEPSTEPTEIPEATEEDEK